MRATASQRAAAGSWCIQLFIVGTGRTEDMPELRTFLRPEDIAFAIRTVLEQPRRLRTQYWTMWSMAQGS